MKILFKVLGIVALASLVMLTSCKGKKNTAATPKGATEISIPCSDKGKSDKNYYRADASAKSSDMSLSREKALSAAKARLASLIQTQIKSVTDRYVNETEVGDKSDYEQKFENLTREVVNQTLADITVACEKNFQETDGKYTTYVAVELDKETILNKTHNSVSKDEKLRVDYDKKKFEEIFNQEMEKLANE